MSELLIKDKATGEWKFIPYIVGPQGPAGKDGESVTITSISESSVDEGANIVNFSDGTSITVRNGSKGEKGDQGATGPRGDKGEDGIDGRSITNVSINDSGELVLTFSDDTTSNLGVVIGTAGADGSNGADGSDGVGITRTEIDGDGRLVITYSDGSSDTLGVVVGIDGQNGVDGTSITHQWEGTVLKVTSASGTSSVDLKGATGSQGPKGDTGEVGPVGPQGDRGDTGNGIVSIIKTSSSELVDTYTITYTDSTTTTFTVTNGSKGEQGIQGIQGIQGEKGADGTAATHKWNGTVLTISSASGTSSADLKGEKGEKGETGAQGIQGPQGPKGDTGATGATGTAGKTPVKGVDYWTEADQESIIQQVIVALGTPVFGRVDTNNNIILTGELANGTYTIKYENSEGTVMEIGTLDHNADAPSYTNLFNTYTIYRDKRNSTTNSDTGYLKESLGAVAVDIPYSDIIDKTLRIKAPNIDEALADGKRTSFYTFSISMGFMGYAFNESDSYLRNAPCAVNEGNNTYNFLCTADNFVPTTKETNTLRITIVVNTTGTAVTDEELSQIVITIDEPIV